MRRAIHHMHAPARGESLTAFTRDKPGGPDRRIPRIPLGDLRMLALLAACGRIVRWQQRENWDRAVERMVHLRYRKHLRKRYPSFALAVKAVLGISDDEAAQMYKDSRRANYRRLIIAAAEMARINWQPHITVTGVAEVKRALAEGHGALIWGTSFHSQTLVGKRGLFEAGLAAHQVSVFSHGLSRSAFGRRTINPGYLPAENRYLAGRISFDRGDGVDAARQVARALRSNKIVLMTNNIYAGTRFAEAAFGAAGCIELATAPANFVLKSKAAMFMMSTFEIKPFEHYEIRIRPIWTAADRREGGSGQGDARRADMAEILLRVRDGMLEDIKRAPSQYGLWGNQVNARTDKSVAGNAARPAGADRAEGEAQ
ncbi:hypothetical protein [Pseudohoeflea coraliihabitans]|uniref:Uncharacterized protein n=1 Tax=Pseudohoeflea coraliihabitans TaxID=2860393 RepID=A0ABS6WID2_9HYPH|nr:hypothetical protein [Pseudohoeflea sp. DP4N28-3]MBW3095706.1 hypothetical protein [Pseudohoeflea sp. DP4N28-3]